MTKKIIYLLGFFVSILALETSLFAGEFDIQSFKQAAQIERARINNEDLNNYLATQLKKNENEKKLLGIINGTQARPAYSILDSLGISTNASTALTDFRHKVVEGCVCDQKSDLSNKEKARFKKFIQQLKAQRPCYRSKDIEVIDTDSKKIQSTYSLIGNNKVYIPRHLLSESATEHNKAVQRFISDPYRTAKDDALQVGLVCGTGYAAKKTYDSVLKPHSDQLVHSLCRSWNKWAGKKANRSCLLTTGALGIGSAAVIYTETLPSWFFGSLQGRKAGTKIHGILDEKQNS